MLPVSEDDVHRPVAALGDLVGDQGLAALDLGVAEATAHEPLDRVDRVVRVRDRLAFRDLADQTLAALGERDDRRRDPAAFGIRDDRRTGNQLLLVELIDKRAQLLDAGDILEQAAGQDPYIFVREAYRQRRQSLIYDGNPPQPPPDPSLFEEDAPPPKKATP